jgi:hypothetical protein
MRLAKLLRILGPSLCLVTLGMGAGTSGAAAYGSADQPLAQVEVSANCNNPNFPLCAPPPTGVGTGGIWLWIEIDSDNTADFSGAGCGHTIGGIGGPGGAGAGAIRGTTSWSYASFAQAAAAGAFFFGIDPNDSYYMVNFGPDGSFAFPTTQGHYSFQPVAGVVIELQIAP